MPRLLGMLDRSLRLTFANFSTFFLVVAVVVVPLHLAHSYAFKRVIEVAELHDRIETFPADRTVRDVGAEDLRDYKASLAILAVLELALLLIVVRPVRKVLADHHEGRVPTATSAWAGGWRSGGGYARALSRDPGPLLMALIFALAVGWLAEMVGLLIVQPLGDERAWVGVALAGAIARALAAPFFLVAWALSAARVKEGVQVEPKLY